MSITRELRPGRLPVVTLILVLLAAAACAPAATPTPTPAPTSTPEPEPTDTPMPTPTEIAVESPEEADDADATPAADDDETRVPGRIAVTTARLREAPSQRGAVITELTQNTPLVALGQTADAGYLYIRTDDGTEGWIAKQSVTLDNPLARLPTRSADD